MGLKSHNIKQKLKDHIYKLIPRSFKQNKRYVYVSVSISVCNSNEKNIGGCLFLQKVYLWIWGSQLALVKKNPLANAGDVRETGSIPGLGGWEDPLEEGLATHSSILAWRVPWTEEPGGYSPLGHKELDVTEAA